MKTRAIASLIIAILSTWLLVVSIHMDTYSNQIVTADGAGRFETVVVFGTVIRDAIPPLQKERLDAAVKLYESGSVRTVVVSNKDTAADQMKSYLVQNGIPEEVIRVDRSATMTSDTCHYLNGWYGDDVAGTFLLLTQSFHIKRAMYLCSHSGVISYGLPVDEFTPVERDNHLDSQITRGYRWGRERALMSLHLAGLYK